jgi:hypothetical protein
MTIKKLIKRKRLQSHSDAVMKYLFLFRLDPLYSILEKEKNQ